MSTQPPPLDAIESAKRAAAIRAVADHFDPSFRYIGIGSGSTIVYVVEAIKAHLSTPTPAATPPTSSTPTSSLTSSRRPSTTPILFVPTGYQSRQVIHRAGLQDIAFSSLPPNTLLDIAFDGADEVDEDLNCIKGGGACLYQEKLVATHARKFICVADHRKLQARLLSKWPSVPVEVEPLAAQAVLARLRELGSREPGIREGSMAKAGPVKTDQDNFIVDAPFGTLVLGRDRKVKGEEGLGGGIAVGGQAEGEGGQGRQWEVEELAREIKLIEGVLSVGIFCGVNGEEMLAQGGTVGGQTPVAAYFGMANGDVVVRRKGEGERLVEKSKED